MTTPSPEATNLPPAPPPERQYVRRRRHDRPSVIFPLVLILLGVIFLLKNTGVIQGNAWEFILSLWPALLIAIGLDNLFRGRNVVGPIFWIALGVVFLLSSLNVITLGILDIILRLWPLFLVAIGLDIFIGRRSIWLSIAGAIVLLAVMAGSLYVLAQGTVASTGGQPISQALNNAGQVQANLNPAVGDLTVSALPSNGPVSALVTGQAFLPGGYNLNQEYNVSGTQGVYSLGLDSQQGFRVFTQGWDWKLAFTGRIPLGFNVNMGAGKIDLDFSQLQISDLNLSLGVGIADLTLPSKGGFSGQLNSAVGVTTIRLPEGIPVQVVADGLSAVTAPSDFTSQDRIYTSPAYDSAASTEKISLQVSQAIGVVRIEYVK